MRLIKIQIEEQQNQRVLKLKNEYQINICDRWKILEEGKIVLMTTQVIHDSFVRKYSAISGLEPDFLRKLAPECLVQRAAVVVVGIQLSGKFQDGCTVIACQGCVDLGDHLRGGQRVIHVWAGRVEKRCDRSPQQNTRRGCRGRATLEFQSLQ